MKTRFEKRISFGELLLVLVMLLVVAFSVSAQNYGTFTNRATGVPLSATLTNAQTLVLADTEASSIPRLAPGQSIDIQVTQVATNATSANVWLSFKTSFDRTTWATTPLVYVTNALNSSTTVVGRATIPASSLGNAQYLKPYSANNGHTNSVSFSKVEWCINRSQ